MKRKIHLSVWGAVTAIAVSVLTVPALAAQDDNTGASSQKAGISDTSLSLGNNLYALPPDALTLGSDKKMMVSDISKDKFLGAAHFAKDNRQQLSDQSFAGQVY